MRLSLLSLPIAAFLLATPLSAQTKPLSGPQLASALSGHSYDYVGMVGGQRFSGTLTYAASGSLMVETDSGAPEGGTWRIKGNAVCTKLVNLRDGNETCYTVRRLNRKRLATSHGFTLIKSR